MAKTLIGNIKGKDGRGISKIEKTDTTGTVDTYTITYTDSTQSTYEVRNSDGIAIQRQIVPSAAVESSATASQAYSAGDYVVVDGVLRRVTGSIAKGDQITDSNSKATTVTGELARKQTRLGNSLTCYVEGGICILSADFLALPYSNANVTIGRLPDGLRPLGHAGVDQTGGEDVAYIGALRYRGYDANFGQMMVTNSGSITAYASVSGDENAYFYGQVVFPVTRS